MLFDSFVVHPFYNVQTTKNKVARGVELAIGSFVLQKPLKQKMHCEIRDLKISCENSEGPFFREYVDQETQNFFKLATRLVVLFTKNRKEILNNVWGPKNPLNDKER